MGDVIISVESAFSMGLVFLQMTYYIEVSLNIFHFLSALTSAPQRTKHLLSHLEPFFV